MKCLYRITVKVGAKPVKLPAQRVPHTRQAPLREELVHMEARGIVVKMEEPAVHWPLLKRRVEKLEFALICGT